MGDLTIGTFNVQNRYKNLSYDGKEDAKRLARFLQRENVDIMGTQEMILPHVECLDKECMGEYSIVGKARWCNNRFSKLPINFNNETNSIISKYKVQRESTHFLARIPLYHTQLSRTVMIADIKVGEELLTFVNTHLDYLSKYQLPHLKRLLEILENVDSKNLLMTGDFNMDIDNSLFRDFIFVLRDRGINRIPMNEPTHMSGKTLDHIFYGSGFEYVGSERIYMNGLSDHDSVLAKVKRK